MPESKNLHRLTKPGIARKTKSSATATFVAPKNNLVFLRRDEKSKCRFATSLQQMKNTDKI